MHLGTHTAHGQFMFEPFLLSQIVIFLFNLIHYIVRIYFGHIPWKNSGLKLYI